MQRHLGALLLLEQGGLGLLHPYQGLLQLPLLVQQMVQCLIEEARQKAEFIIPPLVETNARVT